MPDCWCRHRIAVRKGDRHILHLHHSLEGVRCVAFKIFLFEHVAMKEGLADVDMIDQHVFSSGKSKHTV